MKKILFIITVVSCVMLCSCGTKNKTGNTTVSANENTAAVSQTAPKTKENDVTKNEKSKTGGKVNKVELNQKAIYGKRTGTDKTYTGLEPLPEITFKATDPDNKRGLSTATFEHSYGVSKDGVPHTISVENQKKYEKFGGMCLDTSGEKVIYLTFDCGYENGVTTQILDTLEEKKVPAAFFVTLDYLETASEIAARMINDGHTVGNHSHTHANFSKITRTQMAKEIEDVDNFLRTKFGYSSPFFRFPEGACSDCSLELVQSVGFESVFWSSSYADWDTSVRRGKTYSFETVTSRLHPGCILLLHAVSQDNADALADIIDWAHEQGYEFRQLA